MLFLTGDSLLLSQYQGKPLIVNVWANYCPNYLASSLFKEPEAIREKSYKD
jgi:hypothetical protein